jgi:hypothetical protein
MAKAVFAGDWRLLDVQSPRLRHKPHGFAMVSSESSIHATAR